MSGNICGSISFSVLERQVGSLDRSSFNEGDKSSVNIWFSHDFGYFKGILTCQILF